jgi:hypothetical protein
MKHALRHLNNPAAQATFDDELGPKSVTIIKGSILRINFATQPPENIKQNYKQLREFVDWGLARVEPDGKTVTVLKDLPAVSPSAASVMASGKPGSGWKLWRLDGDRPLERLRGGDHPQAPREPHANALFPNIAYDYPQLPPLNRQTFTVGGMKTIMENRGFGQYTVEIAQPPTGGQMADFEEHIKEAIRDLLQPGMEAGDESYLSVFHKIQLWGGIAGRNIYVNRDKAKQNYVRGGEFEQNFSITHYREIFDRIAHIDSIDAFDKNIPDIINLCGHIKQWGPAFATKHFKFISSASGGFQLPIYDSVIARGLYNSNNAQWNRYAPYVREIHAFAARNNSSVEIMERVLFNHFGFNDA